MSRLSDILEEILSPRIIGKNSSQFLPWSNKFLRLDGVGPREKRPKRPEPAWLSQETNEFGTDEFMKYCEIVGAEPYLALNFGTGTLDEGQHFGTLKPSSIFIDFSWKQLWLGLNTATRTKIRTMPISGDRMVGRSLTTLNTGHWGMRLGGPGRIFYAIFHMFVSTGCCRANMSLQASDAADKGGLCQTSLPMGKRYDTVAFP
jgi:hypothetical protein